MIIEEKVSVFKQNIEKIIAEVSKVIVGQREVVRDVVTALIAGGHVLLEGVPGLGKTMLIRTLGQVLDLSFSRIQFTPDLMPADITGTNLVIESESSRKSFEFQKGPVFAHLVLADEINRATPKTQSALLEAMQEHSVTASGTSMHLPEPFMVLATQNPIEMEGTYPLPEAQLDRFFYKTVVSFPSTDELEVILDRTTGTETPPVQRVLTIDELLKMKQLAREVLMATPVRNYISRLIIATHPGSSTSSKAANQYIRFGASPRGAQTLALGAKVVALSDGRFNVGFSDVRDIFLQSLRHRIILNFEALAEGIEADKILNDILDTTPYETEATAK